MSTAIAPAKKSSIIGASRRHDNDSGSPEVQISLLTERISSLQDHLKVQPKDHASRRGLVLMVGKRNRLLRYLSQNEHEKYANLIKKLGLRK
jgi:small subunit ribosomal protein S15